MTHRKGVRKVLEMNQVKSAKRQATNICLTIDGPDSREIMELVQKVIRRENRKRSLQGKHRFSYEIRTAAGDGPAADGVT